MRYKRPDEKNAISIVNASKKEMNFILTIEVTEQSGSTIVRGIYECFRMLGDALLVKKGIESEDHLAPINELMGLNVNLPRPLGIIGNLRILRHSINYYGYIPRVGEVQDIVLIAKECFEPLYREVLRKIAL